MNDPNQTPSSADASAGPAGAPRRKRIRPWLWLAAGALLLAGAAGLSLLKVWRVSPPLLQPEVRVSLLDLAQARSLAAAARRWAEKGDSRQAVESWAAALANNFADTNLWHAALTYLADQPPIASERVGGLLAGLGWFCELTHTNAPDALLAARACARYEAFELMLALPEPPETPPDLLALRLQALFRQGRFQEFRARFEARPEAVIRTPGFALYHDAYQAIWGEATNSAPARARLQAAMDDPEHGPLAAHLTLLVAYRLGEPGVALAALEKLVAADAARALDHAVVWLTLIRAGARARAAELAQQHLGAPATATEMNLMGRAWTELHLDQRYENVMARLGARLGVSPTLPSAQIWATYAGFLEKRERWAALNDLARTLRHLPGPPEWLQGFADYLEGCAAYHLAKMPLARNRLNRAVQTGFPVGRLAITVAAGLLKMDFPDQADTVLRSADSRLQYYPGYWRAVWNIALQRRRDSARLLAAARWLYEANPRNDVVRFNYAAALLTRRERPAEAIRILRGLWDALPQALYLRLNYALALAQNGRFAEAAQTLSGVNPDRLTEEERATYLMGRLEVLLHNEQWAEARKALAAIDRSYLFPCQKRWLDQIRTSLAAKS
jgi:tetratricopeptide (TPR) repeat protein